MSASSRMMLAASLSCSALLLAVEASAYCPCYTASSPNNTHNCGIEAVAGTNPSTAEWQDIFDLVSQGPAVWGLAGPDVDDIGQGCGNPEPLHSVPPRFPCELLKAIAMAESGWHQFCIPDTPSDQVGPPERTIISFDCGYGVGQVTSGMHTGETPAFDQQRVASDATYNLAAGTLILASKWRATNCVGDNQPSIVEDWYTATWAYNGLAWSNNPNNPNHDASRGVYDPSVGGSYPYQEKVFGRIEHPPSADYWPSLPLAYPNRADCGDSGSPPALPEPSCASPTDCANTRPTHESTCFATEPPDAGTGGAAGTAGSAGSGGSGGSSGASGTGASGGVGGTGGGSVDGSTDAPVADASGGSAGGPSGSGQLYKADDADGCACRAGARPRSEGWYASLMLLGAMLARRRRDHRSRREGASEPPCVLCGSPLSRAGEGFEG